VSTRVGLWRGHSRNNGYGITSIKRRTFVSHRIAYALWHGRPPRVDRPIDHLCRNKLCCNPRHLEVVTKRENERRIPKKTHCPSGHPYSVTNTRFRWRSQTYVDGTIHRTRCRECIKCLNTQKQQRRERNYGLKGLERAASHHSVEPAPCPADSRTHGRDGANHNR